MRRTRVAFWSPWIGLAAGLFVCGVEGVRVAGWLSPAELLLTAFRQCLSAVTAATIPVILFQAALRGRVEARSVQRTAICALWIPPLLGQLQRGSMVVLLPAILLAGSAARLLPGWNGPVSDRTRLAWSFGVAVVIQAAVGLATLEQRALGAIAMAMASAAIVLSFWPAGWRFRGHLTPSWRVSSLVLGSICLLLFGLGRHLKPEWGWGGKDGDSLIRQQIAKDRKVRYGPVQGTAQMGPSNPGIILYPETEPVVKLIAPLPALRFGAGKADRANPLSIPFSGAYWLFRAPDDAPPPGSPTMRGTPHRLGFLSNDGVPLQMEARQNFGAPVYMSCCSEVRLDLLNADTYPDTVQVELILTNSLQDERREFSLGRLPVKGSLARGFFQGGIVVEESLGFPLPEEIRGARFDGMRVRFLLDGFRSFRSARISIARLTMVPYGV